MMQCYVWKMPMYAWAVGDVKICGLWIVSSMVKPYGKYLSFEVAITIGLWRDAKQGWALGLPWGNILTSRHHNLDLSLIYVAYCNR